MTINVQPRNTGTPTLAAAVQGGKPAATKDVTGQAARQADTVETSPAPAAATPPQEKKDDFLSPKFAALARQEKQIRAERQKIKAEREAFEAEKAARLNGYIPKDKLKASPLSALEEAGLSYDELTKQLLEAPQAQVDPTVRALQSQVEALTNQLSQFTKQAEETKSTAYQQALDTIRHKVKGVVEANPSDYEMIKTLDQADAVVALIEETFKADGYVMSEEEAAREVEEHLLSEAIRMAALEKVKKKLAPAPAEETPQAETAAPQQLQAKQPQLTTLTNSVASTSGRRLTEAERRQRAILAAQGKLTN